MGLIGDFAYFSGDVPLIAYGFQSPAAPALVVSIAKRSVIKTTSATGEVSRRRRAEVKPATPPPMTPIVGLVDRLADTKNARLL